MKKTILVIYTLLLTFISQAQIKVNDFYRAADGKDWSKAIQRAFKHIDSLGHGSLEFDGTKNYLVNNSIELPRYSKSGRRIIVINGNGCTINASDSVMVFNRMPKDQKEALNQMMSTRFVINDFTFSGGKKGINLGATYGSSINRCNFQGQSEAAIDIQFGLNTSIFQCNSNGNVKTHFLIRTGEDWGGTAINSQSNHTIVDMCRVYSGKGTLCAYKVLGSSGCVIRDCISEGTNDLDYSIFFSYANSNCVRLFKVENLHLEHAPQKAAFYIHNTGIAIIDGVFYQKAYEGFELVHAANRCDQITLRNVPHYVTGTVLTQFGNEGASWLVEDCSKEFYDPKNWKVTMKEGVKQKLPYYFKGRGYRYQVDKQFSGGK